MKHFVEILTIHHDKAVPPPAWLPKILSPLNVSPPWLLKFSSFPPCLADDTKIIPHPWSQGGGHYVTLASWLAIILKTNLSNIFFSGFLSRVLFKAIYETLLSSTAYLSCCLSYKCSQFWFGLTQGSYFITTLFISRHIVWSLWL